jgi:hypothetical protein
MEYFRNVMLFIQMTEVWDSVLVSIRRDKIPDENGPCANHVPRDDEKTTTLNPGTLSTKTQFCQNVKVEN